MREVENRISECVDDKQKNISYDYYGYAEL